MKVFHCDHCGQLLFFENVTCVRCGRALAYVPGRDARPGELISLDPAPDPAPAGDGRLWTSPRAPQGSAFRLCENYSKHNVCNWALPESDPHALCRACRLTRTIPNLAREGNIQRWYKLEVAKRRLVYTLEQLALPYPSKMDDPRAGLAFDLLEDPDPAAGHSVLTGHYEGVITLNVAEADEAERIKRRTELGEAYRTLLGHFRHEVGHYYWDQWIAGSDRLEAFRRLFGDERADYRAALDRHYREGPRADWQSAHVSAYAAMHPWEDWAETWAHYLHMVDTLETAAACGIALDPPRPDEPVLESVPDPAGGEGVSFDRMMESWAAITYVLNNLNRGMGVDDAYPFVLAPPSVQKLRFVHEAIKTIGAIAARSESRSR